MKEDINKIAYRKPKIASTKKILKCSCEHPKCSGKFIKTRRGQKTCLLSWQKNK